MGGGRGGLVLPRRGPVLVVGAEREARTILEGGKNVILLYYEERRGRGVTRLTPHSEFIGRDEPLYNLSPPLGITPDH